LDLLICDTLLNTDSSSDIIYGVFGFEVFRFFLMRLGGITLIFGAKLLFFLDFDKLFVLGLIEYFFVSYFALPIKIAPVLFFSYFSIFTLIPLRDYFIWLFCFLDLNLVG